MIEGDEPIWPVDLGATRLWPLEGGDGPLLQELFDDLADFRTPFGEPGSADAVSTFLALPESYGYEAKLLVGIWRNGLLVGALDCIMGYPTEQQWTVGLLVIADRHRRTGIGSEVLEWLGETARDRGATTLRATVRPDNAVGGDFLRGRGWAVTSDPRGDPVVLATSLEPDLEHRRDSGLAGQG